MLGQLKGYRIFDADIEIAEDCILRQRASHQRLEIELHALLRLAVVEERFSAAVGV